MIRVRYEIGANTAPSEFLRKEGINCSTCDEYPLSVRTPMEQYFQTKRAFNTSLTPSLGLNLTDLSLCTCCFYLFSSIIKSLYDLSIILFWVNSKKLKYLSHCCFNSSIVNSSLLSIASISINVPKFSTMSK